MQRVLAWCQDFGITTASVYVISADNIRKRDRSEVGYLMELLETLIPQQINDPLQRWRLHVAGDLALLPDSTAQALRSAIERTSDRPQDLTLAIGYDWQQDVVRAVQAALREKFAAGSEPQQAASS